MAAVRERHHEDPGLRGRLAWRAGHEAGVAEVHLGLVARRDFEPYHGAPWPLFHIPAHEPAEGRVARALVRVRAREPLPGDLDLQARADELGDLVAVGHEPRRLRHRLGPG